MKARRVRLMGILMLLLCVNSYSSESDLTPLPGNPLRKMVLNALREEVKQSQGADVVFVVKHLRVKNGWAWVHTQPQSTDGSQRFEDLSALLCFTDGEWTVSELPCGEVDNPDCLNGPEYFNGLLVRFPEVPREVFPDWATESQPGREKPAGSG